MHRSIFAAAAVVSLTLPAAPLAAEVKTEAVTYKDGDAELKGYLAWDNAAAGKRPGVLVVHEWWGLNDYARKRAEMLAGLGYVAFALDMYGEGKTTEHPREAGEWAAKIRGNVEAWRRRAQSGLEVLRRNNRVDSRHVAAIGYCFGGATVLQLAFGGADLAGVASFHGSLPIPEADARGKLKARLLICHGALDSFTPEEQVGKFRAALDGIGADYQMIYYSGARHSFTNPNADGYGVEGVKYDEKADRRSWEQLRTFLAEIFKG